MALDFSLLLILGNQILLLCRGIPLSFSYFACHFSLLIRTPFYVRPSCIIFYSSCSGYTQEWFPTEVSVLALLRADWWARSLSQSAARTAACLVCRSVPGRRSDRPGSIWRLNLNLQKFHFRTLIFSILEHFSLCFMSLTVRHDLQHTWRWG